MVRYKHHSVPHQISTMNPPNEIIMDPWDTWPPDGGGSGDGHRWPLSISNNNECCSTKAKSNSDHNLRLHSSLEEIDGEKGHNVYHSSIRWPSLSCSSLIITANNIPNTNNIDATRPLTNSVISSCSSCSCCSFCYTKPSKPTMVGRKFIRTFSFRRWCWLLLIFAIVMSLMSTVWTLPQHQQQFVAPAGCEWRPRSGSVPGTGVGTPSGGGSSSSSLSHLSSIPMSSGGGSAVGSLSSSGSSSASTLVEHLLLQCHFRTLNGPLDSGVNLSLIPGDRTYALKLLCDDLLFQSQLPGRSFQTFHQLNELYIERCKLSDLPVDLLSGLSELRHLTIRTYNTEWGDLSLRLTAPSIFQPVGRLESLDLSENDLSQLPSVIFCPLTRLQYLNLSRNAINEVAALGFRSKYEQQPTSTSSNGISIAPSEQNDCGSLDSIQHVDASHNRIKVLTDRGFSRLHRLQVLNLRHNLIARAEETSLAGLNELTKLDLSQNQLVALPARFFQAVKTSLTELYLQNNSISVIPPGLFSGLGQVTVLDLSNNEVTSHWIGPSTFADMSRLLSLDLSHNKLSRIDANAFRALFTLQSLSLKNNEIESLAENAFSTNRNLHTLSLSGNRLQMLDAASFTGLQVLNALFLNGNRLQHIHSASFANITGLMELNLASNHLDMVPSAIQMLHSLRSLDLSNNRIHDISNASYRRLEQLYSLNLEGNQIGNLSRGDFLELPSLRVLNLARNRVGSVEQGTFDNIPDLHALRLDSNQVQDINGLFVNLRDLLMLNISANRIQLFDYAMIPVGLQWLDLHENQVENLSNIFEIESELKLRTLDASRNRLSEIDASSLPDSIELVMLNRNQIRKVAPFTFLKKDNLTKADLSENRLQSLDLNALRLAKVPQQRRPQPEFSIGLNPFVCDCQMEWLQRAASASASLTSSYGNQPDSTRQYPRVVDADQIECRLAFGRGHEPMMIALLSARPSQLLCSYRSHCFALCHCCEFDACDCEMTCPDNCTCFYDQSWNTNIVDCGRNNHYMVPGAIPMDVTDLYLDGNNIAELSPHTFIGRKNLRHLHLNASHIYTINNRTFNGLKSLLVLNLADNQLDTLYGYEFERLTDLRELYLQNNLISIIANRTFSALRSLQILRLDNNHLVEFELWSMQLSMPSLRQLYLGNNAWSCDCHFVGQIMQWLPQRQDMIRDLNRIHCQYNQTYSLPIGSVVLASNSGNSHYLSNSDLQQARNNITAACSLYAKRESITASSTSVLGPNQPPALNPGHLPNGQQLPGSSSANNQMEMFIPILVLIVVSTFAILLLLASIVTAVLYRHEISVWLYARTGIRFGSGSSGSVGNVKPGGRRGAGGRHRRSRGAHSDHYDGDSGEKLFDAFVSYSKKDEQFVQQMLAPELEYGSTPMRLCLHYRDLPVATGFVADAIIEAMAASRRTILVISEHFLRGEWTQYEFKTAHQEALRSRARHKLILIFVGPVAGKDLDPDIRVWLKTSGNTCLQWGEKMFWEKLRYAMPEIPTASSGAASSINSSSSSTTSSLYGRKAIQLNNSSKGSTLPLSLTTNTPQPAIGRTNQLTDSYQHQLTLGSVHHPLLAHHHTTTLSRVPAYHSPMMDQRSSMVHALYSPSSIHSQQSTYAYPTYQTGPSAQQSGGTNCTPPPLPPSHPSMMPSGHRTSTNNMSHNVPLFHTGSHSNNNSGSACTTITTTAMDCSSNNSSGSTGGQHPMPQHATHHHFHQTSQTSNNSSTRLNQQQTQQAYGGPNQHNSTSNDSSLVLTSNGSDISAQSTMPFVPSASSTTAVAVHI